MVDARIESLGRQRLPVRALNALGSVLRAGGVLPPLRVDALVRAARRRTRLHDFGDEWFLEPLTVLVESIEREARLSTLGRAIMRTRLVDALSTRLRVHDLLHRHPEITELPLPRGLVIAGLQRTGTTLLHRLLGADPRVRALRSWEAMDPVPAPGHSPRARLHRAWLAQRALAYLSPQFFAIHPVEHAQPEEDVLLLDLSFMSQSPEAMMWVPSYSRWLEQADHGPAYRYLRQLLQILLWQEPGQAWVLKTPHHMEYLDVLLETFPEAVVVQTHRDPRKTMPSFCSMVCHGAALLSDHVDVPRLSEHWLRKAGRMVERSHQARAVGPADRFVDVAYRDLLEDPVTHVQRLYERIDLPFDAAARRAVARRRAGQTRHKYGRHHYRLEDFGLSEASIERVLGAYRQRHAIPFEQP